MKQKLFGVMQGFEMTGDNFTKLIRVDETINYDRDDATEFITTYITGGKDDSADLRRFWEQGYVSAATFSISAVTITNL
jgi:hypothetical protein